MADAKILGGAASAKVKLDDSAFGAAFNGPLVHDGRGTIAAIDPRPFVEDVSTKKAASLLGDLLGNGPILVVLTDEHERAALSFRNLPRVSVLPAEAVGVVDVIGAANVVASQE